MYIALGAPQSCPACPNGEPDKSVIVNEHDNDVQQIPSDMGDAATLAQQRHRNVTVHLKRHHKPHQKGEWVGEYNHTFTSDSSYSPGGLDLVTSEGLSSSEATTSTTTTTDYSSGGPVDYDYAVVDYVYSTTTSESGGHHQHKHKVPLLPVIGKSQRQHKGPGSGPPHTTVSQMPGGPGVHIVEKKTRLPGVPPGEPQPLPDDQVTVTDAAPSLNDMNTIITNGGPYPSGKTVVRYWRASPRAALAQCSASDNQGSARAPLRLAF